MRGRYVGGRRVLGVGSYGRSTLSATGQDTLAGADEADNPPSPHPPTHSTSIPPYPTIPIKTMCKPVLMKGVAFQKSY